MPIVWKLADCGDAYDLIVLGSGGAGLTAALVAATEGLDVLVVERTDHIGGTTASSSGTLWVPGYRSFAAPEEQTEASAKAKAYLEGLVGNAAPAALRDQFLRQGPDMMRYLAQHSEVTFRTYPRSQITMATVPKIAERLSAARAVASPLAEYPGAVPADLQTAYAVQEAMIARMEDTIVGRKVAVITDAFQARFAAPRFAGPIFSRTLVRSGDGAASPCAISGGFCAAEAEFAVRIAHDIPPDLPPDVPLAPISVRPVPRSSSQAAPLPR